MKAEVIFQLSDQAEFDYEGKKQLFPIIVQRRLAIEMGDDLPKLRTELNNLVSDNLPQTVNQLKADFDQAVVGQKVAYTEQEAAKKTSGSKLRVIAGDVLRTLLPVKEPDAPKS